MKQFLRTIFILMFSIIGMTSCKSSTEETDAKDYMPFLSNGTYLIRWQRNSTITIAIPNTGPTGYQTSFDAAIKAGFNQWTPILNELGITLNYIVSGNNDIAVQWHDGTPDSQVSSGVIGYAAVDTSVNPSRYILMTTRCNICSGNPSHSAATITLIAAHEFGHMLGIWNHSFETTDMMYPYAIGQSELSGRDIGTMKHLYNFSSDLNLSGLIANTLEQFQSPPPETVPYFSMKMSCGFGNQQSKKDYGSFEFEGSK